MRLGGAATLDARRYPVNCGFDYRKKIGRREWVRARLVMENGILVAQKYKSGGSGILTSMVFADGLVELPEERADVKLGESVDFLPFNEVTR